MRIYEKVLSRMPFSIPDFLKEIEKLINFNIQIPWLWRDSFLPGEIEEVIEQLLQSIALVPDKINLGPGSAGRLISCPLGRNPVDVFSEQLHIKTDARQGVANLVRGAACRVGH